MRGSASPEDRAALSPLWSTAGLSRRSEPRFVGHQLSPSSSHQASGEGFIGSSSFGSWEAAAVSCQRAYAHRIRPASDQNPPADRTIAVVEIRQPRAHLTFLAPRSNAPGRRQAGSPAHGNVPPKGRPRASRFGSTEGDQRSARARPARLDANRTEGRQ